MAFSACFVESAFSSMPRETAREVSSVSARVGYIKDMLERGAGAAVEESLALLCTVGAASGSRWYGRNGLVSSHT